MSVFEALEVLEAISFAVASFSQMASISRNSIGTSISTRYSNQPDVVHPLRPSHRKPRNKFNITIVLEYQVLHTAGEKCLTRLIILA
jgi:hypothetical protein